MELKLYLTRRCNFRCTYCYVPFKNEEANPAVTDKIIDLLTDDDTLSLFGGEPLLFGDMIVDLLDRLDKKGNHSYVKIFTNGSFIHENLLEKLKTTDRNVMVQVSYDGTRQAFVHHMGGVKITNVEDNIQRYITEFQGDGCTRCAINQHERTLHIEMTSTPDSIDGMADGVRRMIDLGVKSMGIVPVIEVDKWTEQDASAYKEQFLQIKDMVADTYRQGNSVFITHLSPFRSTNQDLWGCGAGKYLLSVSPDGELWSCHRYYALAHDNDERKNYNFGNILDVSNLKTLEDSLQIPVPMKDLRCGTCEARQFCTKCHLANKVLNGDEFLAPNNGYCQIPFVHKAVYEIMQNTLLNEGNPTFVREVFAVLRRSMIEQYGIDIPPNDTPTILDITSLANKVISLD